MRKLQFHRATQQRAHAGEKFEKFERLGQVIVSAVVEACDAVFDGIPRGKHENGNFKARFAQTPANFKATEAGKHNVKNNQVVGIDFRLFERLDSVGNSIDRVGMFFQPLNDKVLNAGIVFCNQDSHKRMIRETG